MMGIRQLSQGEVRRDLTTKDTKENEGSRLGFNLSRTFVSFMAH